MILRPHCNINTTIKPPENNASVKHFITSRHKLLTFQQSFDLQYSKLEMDCYFMNIQSNLQLDALKQTANMDRVSKSSGINK